MAHPLELAEPNVIDEELIRNCITTVEEMSIPDDKKKEMKTETELHSIKVRIGWIRCYDPHGTDRLLLSCEVAVNGNYIIPRCVWCRSLDHRRLEIGDVI